MFFYAISLLCLVIHCVLLKKLESISSWMEKDTRLVLWMNGVNSVIIGAPDFLAVGGAQRSAMDDKALKIYTGQVLKAVEGRVKKKKPKQKSQIYYLENSRNI